MITELRETTYYADLEVSSASGLQHISARPSDAVALAVRAGCPIFSSEEVLDTAGFIEDTGSDDDSDDLPEAVVEEFKQFIEQVSPEKLLRGSKYAVDVPICLVAAGSAVAIRNQSPRVQLAAGIHWHKDVERDQWTKF